MQRHGIGRLPEVEGNKPAKKKFKTYPIGFFHIFGRRLKTLKGLTPYEFIWKSWTSEPNRFSLNPLHQMPGLNI